MKHINLVLKVTERCNLNCSYCYYFNGLDNSFKSKPAAIDEDTIYRLSNFLLEGLDELNIKALNVTLHGGEPLLLHKERFKKLCTILQQALGQSLEHFTLSLQTNGTLIDEEWIQIFEKYNIKLGISLDGLEENHDLYRIDHSGKGSYNRIVKSIHLLQKNNYDFGCLAVINPNIDARKLFHGMVTDLGIKGVDFLWPDNSYNYKPAFSIEKYGKFAIDMFNTWIEHGDSDVQIRFFESHINCFLGKRGLIYGQGVSDFNQETHVFAVRSDGELSCTDELMSADPKAYSSTGKTIFNTSLRDFFQLPVFKEIEKALSDSPSACRTCCWSKSCGGGNLVNRYSHENKFDNPSVYCDGLKSFYSNLLGHLIKNGVSAENIAKNIKL